MPAKNAAPVLKFSPAAGSGKAAEYQPPLELLDAARFAKIDKSCEATNRFVLAASETRPFDRLRFLRGDNAVVELARGTKEIRGLLAMLHELFLQRAGNLGQYRGRWRRLPRRPGRRRFAPDRARNVAQIFKPLYREYCKILHARDKFVFFRSQGHIVDVLGDLVKIGVDAVQSQIHKMDAEKLAKRFRGHVTFWGEIDLHALARPVREPGERRRAQNPPRLGLRLRRRHRPVPLDARPQPANHRRRLRAVATPLSMRESKKTASFSPEPTAAEVTRSHAPAVVKK